MRELRAADRTRQQQIIQTLTVMQTLQREMISLQGLVTTLQGQVTTLQGQVMTLQGQVTALQGQQGPAGGPAQPELPEEAGYDFMKSNVVSAILPHVTPPRNGIDSQLRGRVWGSKRVALRVHLPGFHEKWQTSVFQGHELVVVELTIAFDKNGECFHAYKATDKVGKTRIVPPEDVNKIERSLSEVARHESMETS
ncbi:hypothetical protein Tco_0799153 [Tanacetum coccineum]